MTHMQVSTWLTEDTTVTSNPMGATVSMWIGEAVTIFGTPEALGIIGERIAEEAHRIIEARLDDAALHRAAMAEEVRYDEASRPVEMAVIVAAGRSVCNVAS